MTALPSIDMPAALSAGGPVPCRSEGGRSEAGWPDLARALDSLGETGRRVGFWLRDDDAVAPTPALDRLLGIAADLPLALAVIPARATAELADRLPPDCAVLQHGLAHADHAPPGEKKAEYGPHRPLAAMTAELAAGRSLLQDLFGRRALPVLVPPWNRIADTVAAALPGLGFGGLSTFGCRTAGVPALVQVNTHVDPIDWRGSRGFAGETAVLGRVVDALRHHLADEFREGAARGPIGLLTHHLVMDGPGWAFLDRFLTETRRHPAVRWQAADELFVAGASR